MAGVAKVHPVTVATNFEQVGKDLTFFIVDYIDDVSSNTGPTDIIQEVYHIIQQYGVIVAAGPLVDTGSQQTFAVEGVLAAADLSAMEADIQAGAANASATVTATDLGILTAAAV